MNITKIVTHNGLFHADEVFGIALINVLNGSPVPVTRSRTITAEDYENLQTWVIDVGGKYEPELNNLDHHQNKDLEAACVLVLDHLMDTGYCSYELGEELRPSFMAISHIDRNGYENVDGFQVNSLIKSFNNLENGFQLAVSIAESYIKAAQSTVEKAYESFEVWKLGKVIGNVRICNNFPIHWKRYKEQAFLVAPDMAGVKWNVHSIDSSVYPVLSTGVEEFIHAGRFIATFSDKESAVACAVHSDNSL